MKQLFRTVKNNDLAFHVEYCKETNQFRISASQKNLSTHFMIDAFDVARSYSNRELEDTIVDSICSDLRLEKEDEY